MGSSQMAADAMQYIGALSPILLLIGGISFADITINYLIRLFKAGKIKIK